MRIVMYHYVREPSELQSRLRFLHIDNFRRQLDFLKDTYHFPSFAAVMESLQTGVAIKNSIVLTFDDGLSDHYDYVFPELKKRNLWGLFFPTAAPYRSSKLLDVHRIHLLASLHAPHILLKSLYEKIEDHMLDDLHKEAFQTEPYRHQNDEKDLTQFKRVLNYLIKYEWRETILDDLSSTFLSGKDFLSKSYYLSELQIQEMHQEGMIIGAHTVNHRVLSKLNFDEQSHEIMDSFAFLEKVLGPLPVRTFCYPYGGAHTFTKETIKLLKAANCQIGFSVDPRETTNSDLKKQPLALPRFDCTMFPHGQSENG